MMFQCQRGRYIEYTGCLLMSFMAWGVLLAFGTFLPHTLDKYGDSRTKSSTLHSVIMGVTLITGVFSGALIKKFGTGIITFIGALCLAGGFIVSFFATGIEILYGTIGVVAGIGCSFTYVSAVVSTGRLFQERRQTVFLAIQNISGGFGGIVLPYFFDWLIRLYGINGTFLVLGGIFLNIVACAILLYYSKTNVVISDKPVESSTDKEEAHVAILSMKSPTFICLLLCVTIETSNLGGIFAILVDMFTFKQLTHSEGLVCLVIFNVTNTVSRFLPILINCFSNNHWTTLLVATTTGFIGSLTLLLSTSFPLIAFGTAAIGVSDGATMASLPVIVFKLVAPKSQPFAYGLIFTAIGVIMTGLGPMYGAIYDITLSYFSVLIVSSSMYLLAVICAAGCVLTYRILQKNRSPSQSVYKVNESFEMSANEKF